MTTRAFMYINAATSLLALSFLFWLLYLRHGGGDAATLSFLPAVNAALNATTSAFLIRGWFAIKAGNRDLHAFCQKTAFVFSALFLICYILYHSVHGDSHFPGQGAVRGVYFFILISHILLSMAALPLVLATFFFALDGQWARHRKVARFTFPIWLYVSITGVLVFAFLKSAGV
jgi:putative membrane protein